MSREVSPGAHAPVSGRPPRARLRLLCLRRGIGLFNRPAGCYGFGRSRKQHRQWRKLCAHEVDGTPRPGMVAAGVDLALAIRSRADHRCGVSGGIPYALADPADVPDAGRACRRVFRGRIRDRGAGERDLGLPGAADPERAAAPEGQLDRLAAAGIVIVGFAWRAAEWQNSIRERMEMPPVEDARPLEVLLDRGRRVRGPGPARPALPPGLSVGQAFGPAIRPGPGRAARRPYRHDRAFRDDRQRRAAPGLPARRRPVVRGARHADRARVRGTHRSDRDGQPGIADRVGRDRAAPAARSWRPGRRGRRSAPSPGARR